MNQVFLSRINGRKMARERENKVVVTGELSYYYNSKSFREFGKTRKNNKNENSR